MSSSQPLSFQIQHGVITTEDHFGTSVWHCCPTSSAHVRTLIVYLVLAGYLSHTLNIFIFFCNFPGRRPNLTRERSIPLFRLRLHAFQISCLLLWLQRDANILVQDLRSNQHTLYLSLSVSVSLSPVSCPANLNHLFPHTFDVFCLAFSWKLLTPAIVI